MALSPLHTNTPPYVPPAQHDTSMKDELMRLDRIGLSYTISRAETVVTSPLGGGLYILVPYLSNLGVQTISISGGVIPSPLYRFNFFDQMTNADWQISRARSAPWADFETSKVLLSVPTSWIYAMDDARGLAHHYETCMDGATEFVGVPPWLEHRHVLFLGVDMHIRWTSYSMGYPQVSSMMT